MPSESRDSLKKTLIANYRELLSRLTRQFGSREVAEDALQDTWLQLERAGKLDKIRNERAFLFRIAYNQVRNRLKHEKRNVSSDSQPEQIDASPDPERTALARADLSFLLEAMEDMPRRRQQIFLMAFYHERSPVEIAKHFGISVRLVHSEVAKARDHCTMSFIEANKSGNVVHKSRGSTVLDMRSFLNQKDKK